MVYIYIIKSGVDGSYYVGITKDINRRLDNHNRGEVKSTKQKRPFTIIYKEEFEDYFFARKREKQIKSWKGGNAFKKLLAGAAGSSNGRTRDSESRYLGSNPSPAAKQN